MVQSKSNRKLAMLFLLLSIAWIGVLFAESSQPPAPIMGEISGLDKVAHFCAFGVLALLVGVSIFSYTSRLSIFMAAITLLLVTITGIADELYQLSNPSRAFELLDLIADISGAFVSLFLFKLILNRKLFG